MGGVSEQIKALWQDFIGIIWPNLCEACGRSLAHGEKTLCLHCLTELPRVGLHNNPFSQIHHRLAGHTPIEKAASWFYYYRDTRFAQMIQRAKYNSRPALAHRLGEMMSGEIKGDGFFDGIDIIIPVPLHKLKKLVRGYNQSEEIARGIAKATGLSVEPAGLKAKRHSTQTRRNAYSRWLNTRSIYSVAKPEVMEGKHVLVVDDVLTTGATLLACIDAIHASVPTAKISVLTLGLTHLR